MKHVLVGYGYTASYLINQLKQTQEPIEAYARNTQKSPTQILDDPFVNLIQRDVVKQGLLPQSEPFYLYYFIPPPNSGNQDSFLKKFLSKTNFQLCKAIVYISSSGVYGDHQGAWVDEESECHITTERQQRRMDAEKQFLSMGKHLNLPIIVLRCAGIYGPNRLPIAAANAQRPIIIANEAPFTNLIYVIDLSKIIAILVSQRNDGIYNTADGNPRHSGFLQQVVAQALKYPLAPTLPFDNIYQQSSNMKRFFIQSSKRLVIKKLRSCLPTDFQFTQQKEAVLQSLTLQGEQ